MTLPFDQSVQSQAGVPFLYRPSFSAPSTMSANVAELTPKKPNRDVPDPLRLGAVRRWRRSKSAHQLMSVGEPASPVFIGAQAETHQLACALHETEHTVARSARDVQIEVTAPPVASDTVGVDVGVEERKVGAFARWLRLDGACRGTGALREERARQYAIDTARLVRS